MEFKVKKYDRYDETPKWVEFICSTEHEEYIKKQHLKNYINVIFKNKEYVGQIAYQHIDHVAGIMEIRVNIVCARKQGDVYSCDAESFRVMREYEEVIKREEDAQTKKDKEVLRTVKELTSRYKVGKLKEYLVDCENTFKYEIVDKQRVYGIKQDEDYWFKYVWINQHTGYAGDDYSGTIFVPITETHVFKFQYCM